MKDLKKHGIRKRGDIAPHYSNTLLQSNNNPETTTPCVVVLEYRRKFLPKYIEPREPKRTV